MADVFFSVDPQWEAVVNYWAREELTCERCGYRFYEIDNVGAWRCAQHAVFSPSRKSVWSCCNKASHERGCVPADHTTLPIPFDETHDQRIPTPLKDAVGIYEKSAVEETSDSMGFQSTITVRRFDWRTSTKLGRSNATPATRNTVLLDDKRWIEREELKRQRWLG